MRDDNNDGKVAFLEGGGELGALMRGHDWAATPLGPPHDWPQSLKTAVRIMLTSRQPFWLGWGPELTYLYNDPYKSIIGGKHPWALGKPFREVWKEIIDFAGPVADRVMSRDEGSYFEAQLLIMERHGYQEETYYTFSYGPIPGDDGRVGGLICANTDDTQRVVGERQLATLRELSARTAPARAWQEACRLAVEALGVNGRDIPFALAFVESDGGGPLELTAASPGTAALHDPARWPLAAALDPDAEPQVVAIDGLAALPTGAWDKPPTLAAVLPIASSGGSGRSGALVVGLNPFRRFDADYRGFLELVSGQLSAAIANAEAYEQERRRAESLAELDRAKTTFFSNVSHEFRTPLTLTLGSVEELLADGGADLPPSARTQLEVARRNGERLLKLVNTLLDFARIEAGRAQTHFEATDLAALTADLAANFRSACERAGVNLVVDVAGVSTPAWVDRSMWEKIVLNLVSNAFKFTLQGEIAITLREGARAFELAVSDTGTGIPEHALPNMFQRFFRVEGSGGRSHEGSGIGLALVQELVKQHGGSIGVESELGRGTTFRVSIPRGKDHLPADHVDEAHSRVSTSLRADAYVNEALSWLPGRDGGAAAPKAPPDAPRVLVADDNSDLRDYLQRLLQDQYRVETAANGREALAAARRERPALIVSDVMMPGLDGFGLVREIRADPVLRSTPIVLLSARAGEEARITGMGSGADDYLVKPFSARELLVRVGALIQAEAVRQAAGAEVEHRARQFETLIAEAPLGICLVDQDLRIVAMNEVARPGFGDAPDLVGRDLEEVLHEQWARTHADDVVKRFRDTLDTGEPFHVAEMAETRRGGQGPEYYEWQINRIPLPGGRHGVVCYFRDISKVVAAREALRESDTRKDEFLATLSHELRNPLAPIRNSLHVLRLTRDDPAAGARVQDIMERQVNHLVRLVDDLLEMSRISRGALELRKAPVELATIVRDAMEASEPLFDAAEHRTSVTLPSEPLWLDGDPVRLSQVLGNILNNAAKYTPRGGLVDVVAQADGREVVIRVRDSGIGIRKEDKDRIFDMFVRGEDRHGQGGLGIGLALAQKLVAMHGGRITVSSAGPGQGSEFAIRLPLARAPSAQGITGQLGTALPSRRILVIEDNRDAGDSLAMILRMLGADVRVARDGPEGLAQVEAFDPEIVLLDIGMPGMDGYEVARRIRGRGAQRDPTIIALTGWGQEQDRKRVRDAGFDHHLVKPADIDALHALLASL